MRIIIPILLVVVLLTASLENCFSQSYSIVRVDDNIHYSNSLDSYGCSSSLDIDNPEFRIIICMDKYYPCDFINDTVYIRFEFKGFVSLNHTTFSDTITIKDIGIRGVKSSNKDIKYVLNRKEVENYNLFIDYFKLLLSNIDICYSIRDNKEIDDTSVFVPMFVWITFVPRVHH